MKVLLLFVLIVGLFSFNINSDELSGKKILFDAIHDQGAGNSDWFIDASYSNFADELENLGAEINSIEGDWTKDVVLDFDVLIIPEPQTPFTTNEKNIIDEMLKNGKSIFVIGNGAGIDTNEDGYDCPTILNDLLSKYEISANNDSLSGNPLKIEKKFNAPFIKSNESVSCWNGMTFNDKNLKPAIKVDNKIFVGYTEINSGKLVVCGDADMFGDGTGTNGDKLYNDYKLGTHKTLSVNIIKYLLGLTVVVEPPDNNDNDNNNEYNPSDNPFEEKYNGVKNLSNDELKQALKSIIRKHTAVGYTNAKKLMFGEIDNVNGKVQCCYTDLVVSCHGIPNNSVMNCEHTWPQSKFGGSSAGEKKCDLFHLYPTDSQANSRRSNHPFGYVQDITWNKDGSKLGRNSKGTVVYEPPDRHKGNVARAIFYFSTCYNMPVSADQEKALKEWMKLDPVDDAERARNNKIYGYQGNRNPFIDHPEFVQRISNF